MHEHGFANKTKQFADCHVVNFSKFPSYFLYSFLKTLGNIFIEFTTATINLP